MKPLTLAFALLAGCASSAAQSQRAYYVTQPAAVPAADSTMEAVHVAIDERTVIWLNGMLITQRANLHEWGACLRIAAADGTSFKVDSVFAALILGPPTWRSARFVCPEEAAPIHWHIVTPALGGWLQAQGDTSGFAVRARCTPSSLDTSPFWARYRFNALQCGLGIDSIIVYRVKTRTVVVPRKADLGTP